MVGVTVLEMHILGSESLKDKRRVIKSLKERLKQRFNVSVHESNYHDNRQKAELEIAVTSRDKTGAEKVLQEVLKFAEIDGRAEIVNFYNDYFYITR